MDIPASEGVAYGLEEIRPSDRGVPNHRGDPAPGTLRSICKGAGWDYPPEY